MGEAPSSAAHSLARPLGAVATCTVLLPQVSGGEVRVLPKPEPGLDPAELLCRPLEGEWCVRTTAPVVQLCPSSSRVAAAVQPSGWCLLAGVSICRRKQKC